MEKFDVIIVGVGLAGLNAARKLTQAGQKNLIIEANDRVGGRVNSKKVVENQNIDLGAQWIGPGQKRMYALVKEFGLELELSQKKGLNYFELLGKNYHNRSEYPKLPFLALIDLLQMGFLLSSKAMLTNPAKPWLRKNANKLDKLSIADWLDKKMFTSLGHAFWTNFIESLMCTATKETTVLDILQQISSIGGLGRLFTAEKHLFRNGAGTLVRSLAKELSDRIVFNTPVDSIDQTGNGVIISSDKDKWHCQKVIVAIPTPLVSKIKFNKPLPAMRLSLQNTMVQGRVIKSVAVFDQPYWLNEKKSGLVFSDSDNVNVIIDGSTTSNHRGVLIGLITGAYADNMMKFSVAERKKTILNHMRKWHKSLQNIEPLFYEDCDWFAEKWSGGGYAARFQTGCLTVFGKALRAPFGAIHWAGTETAIEWRSYMEGALESGERAANEILTINSSKK